MKLSSQTRRHSRQNSLVAELVAHQEETGMQDGESRIRNQNECEEKLTVEKEAQERSQKQSKEQPLAERAEQSKSQGGQMGQGGNEPGAMEEEPQQSGKERYAGLEKSVEFEGKECAEPHPEHAHITSSLVEDSEE